MTMVERVAMAICCALGDDPDREGKRLTAYEDEAERDAARDPNDPRAKFAGLAYVAIDVSPMGFRPTAPGYEARYSVSGGNSPASAPERPAERDLGGEG